MHEQLRPSRAQTVTEDEVEALVHGICFKTGPPSRLGVELEWLVHDLHDPVRPLHPSRLTAATDGLRTLPLRSALTFEPGGQLELSSRPASTLTSCIQEMTEDLSAVRAFLTPLGLGLAGHGHDPWRPPRRLLTQPRYRAMERYLDRWGPAGRTMMCRTASVQVCVDAGHEEPGPLGYGRRWRLAHLLGAVLVAAFANSPLDQGRPTGWRSTRQAAWAAIDPGRTQAPAPGPNPRTAWTHYVLAAPVMCVRDPNGGTGPWDVPDDELSLRDWVRGGLFPPPSLDDVRYHISTLFPPVRPRGHLELRMIDAQPGPDGWVVPLAVTAALFDDPAAAEAAYRAVKPLADTAGGVPAPRNPLWERAAQRGLADPELHAAALACFEAAQEALPRLGAPGAVADAVASFHERYVAQGRCPADDVFDSVSGKEVRP